MKITQEQQDSRMRRCKLASAIAEAITEHCGEMTYAEIMCVLIDAAKHWNGYEIMDELSPETIETMQDGEST